MPRPRKKRFVCSLPHARQFGPVGNPDREYLSLQIEEYEAIRLIDHEHLDQQTAAERMNIARTTLQRIYHSAKQKVAEALVHGKTLDLSGGDYILCDGSRRFRECAPCQRRKRGRSRRGRNRQDQEQREDESE